MVGYQLKASGYLPLLKNKKPRRIGRAFKFS